jgi:hypothetical protein
MQDLTLFLEKMAEKLGTTTEYLWSILLKQAPIFGYCYVSGGFLILIFGLLLYRFHKKCRSISPNYKTYYEEDEWRVSLNVMLLAAFLIVSVIWLVKLPKAITAFMNPEYWALQEILKQIK